MELTEIRSSFLVLYLSSSLYFLILSNGLSKVSSMSSSRSAIVSDSGAKPSSKSYVMNSFSGFASGFSNLEATELTVSFIFKPSLKPDSFFSAFSPASDVSATPEASPDTTSAVASNVPSAAASSALPTAASAVSVAASAAFSASPADSVSPAAPIVSAFSDVSSALSAFTASTAASTAAAASAAALTSSASLFAETASFAVTASAFASTVSAFAVSSAVFSFSVRAASALSFFLFLAFFSFLVSFSSLSSDPLPSAFLRNFFLIKDLIPFSTTSLIGASSSFMIGSFISNSSSEALADSVCSAPVFSDPACSAFVCSSSEPSALSSDSVSSEAFFFLPLSFRNLGPVFTSSTISVITASLVTGFLLR